MTVEHAVDTVVQGVPAALSPGRPERHRTTAEMIDDCFRHQHPEAYGREQVPQVAVPWELECGRDHMISSQACSVAEDAMGNPDAVQLDTA